MHDPVAELSNADLLLEIERRLQHDKYVELRAAAADLLCYVADDADFTPKVRKAIEGEDGMAPFFSETCLYELLGKEAARSVRSRLRALFKVLDLDMAELSKRDPVTPGYASTLDRVREEQRVRDMRTALGELGPEGADDLIRALAKRGFKYGFPGKPGHFQIDGPPQQFVCARCGKGFGQSFPDKPCDHKKPAKP